MTQLQKVYRLMRRSGVDRKDARYDAPRLIDGVYVGTPEPSDSGARSIVNLYLGMVAEQQAEWLAVRRG